MKATKEFEGSPEDYEETFKVKLMGKFTDIYQTISQLCSKSDLESSIEKVKKTVSRHEGELSDIREEMAKNSDYFTFYMNNSNEEDLSSRIKEISDKLADKETALNDRFKKQTDRNEILQAEITKATEQLQ